MTENQIIYGLVCNGASECGWRFQAGSKKLFKSKQSAEQYIPTFKVSCEDRTQINCVDPNTAKYSIIEYELEE